MFSRYHSVTLVSSTEYRGALHLLCIPCKQVSAYFTLQHYQVELERVQVSCQSIAKAKKGVDEESSRYLMFNGAY